MNYRTSISIAFCFFFSVAPFCWHGARATQTLKNTLRGSFSSRQYFGGWNRCKLGLALPPGQKRVGALGWRVQLLDRRKFDENAVPTARRGVFNFNSSDALVDLAEAAKMEVVGHALVWHHQVPSWIFVDDRGERVSREVLIERMRTHIFTVMQRYKGRVKYWDVVNEAVDLKFVEGEQVAFLRKSLGMKLSAKIILNWLIALPMKPIPMPCYSIMIIV